MTLPGSLLAGDLGVLIASAGNFGNNTTYSVPGDFTKVTDGGRGTPATGATAVCFAKILETSDISRLINTVNGDTEANFFYVLRPDAAISGFAYNTWDFEGPISQQPAQDTVDLSVPATPFVWFGHAGADDSTPSFSTNSPAFTATASVSGTSWAARAGYLIYNVRGSAGATLRASDGGNNNIQMTGWISVY